MEIGIVTFHASYNCGSILQAMALKQILEKKGHKVEIINFSSEGQQKLYSVFYKKLTLKNIIKNFLCIRGYSKIKKHYCQYKEYITHAFLLKGDYFHSSNEIKKAHHQYDMLIAGGDQIWNVNCDDFSTVYFLDFDDNTYKISYSPSLGATDITKSPRAQDYKNLLMKFNALSCREVNGKKWLEQLTGREVELIADPTMLLTEKDWEEKINHNIEYPFAQEFIFYYAFSYSAENNKCVQRLAEEHNLKVVVIDAKQWFIKGLDRYKNFILCEQTGPEAFLNLMKDSKCVVTTSFHGTVFSLIFHKNFIYINNKNHELTDDRTSFLLKQMNLMDHYIFAEDVTWKKIMEPIDYGYVKKSIDTMKKKANNYLDNNIKMAQKQ